MVHSEALSYLRRIQAVPNHGPKDREWVAGVLPLYLEMIERRVHFAQAAYRDGEYAWIVGDTSIRNANGEVWEPELGSRLADTLLNPVGQWCVYFEAADPRRAAADAWLEEHEPAVEWIADRPFARASEHGMAAPFFRALRERSVCVVGPGHLDALPQALLRPADKIYVPDASAWQSAERLAAQVERSDCDLFLIAAGSASNLIVHRAWPRVKHRATLIDVGAMLDPYAGVYSRKKHLDTDWRRDVLLLNMP